MYMSPKQKFNNLFFAGNKYTKQQVVYKEGTFSNNILCSENQLRLELRLDRIS